MIRRFYSLPAVYAIVIWLTVTAFAVGWWSLLMIGTESDPMNYAYARDYYEGQAQTNHMTSSIADQGLKEIRRQLLSWIFHEVRFPVLISAASIPLLTLLVARTGSDRWAVATLAIGLAFIIPVGFLIADTSNSFKQTHQSPVVAPSATPSPMPGHDFMLRNSHTSGDQFTIVSIC